MASEQSSQERIELVIPADDLILPFQAEHADVVGRLVKLGPVVDTILSRHDYPEPVSQLLGEGVAVTALLGASLKFEGKFPSVANFLRSAEEMQRLTRTRRLDLKCRDVKSGNVDVELSMNIYFADGQ